MNSQLLEMLREGDNLKLLVVAGVFALWIVAHSVRRMVEATAREKSRREIAAYIAEGSMTPEQGQKLMAAKNPDKHGA